ncbi:hypothetical protein ABZY05_47830 [Streptomyces canus]
MSTSTLGRFAIGRGPHVCPGAPSARREVVIAVSGWSAFGFTKVPARLG